MDVSEIVRLAEWFRENTKQVETLYLDLVSVLQNNAQQSAQMPVKAALDSLSKALAEMPTQELSTLQMRVLDKLGVAELIGKAGESALNTKVRATTYDPATTHSSIASDAQSIEEAQRRLLALKNSAEALGLKSELKSDTIDSYTINVIFQGQASIENVRDWKKSAAEWELIMSGVAGVAGERPEDVRVLGTANGSIIFTLSASSLVTKILATISKHIAEIANRYLDFQLKRESLDRSRMLTKVMKDELLRQETESRSTGQRKIIEAVKKIVPSASPEALSNLELAVSKQIAFSEQGGDVDFIPPNNIDEDSDSYDKALAIDVANIRKLIEEYQTVKQQVKLLGFDSKIIDDEK